MKTYLKLIAASTVIVSLAACNDNSDKVTSLQSEVSNLKAQVSDYQKQVARFEAKKALETKNIALYDKMDLVAFTNHDMDTIAEIHADDVKVYNPDGSLTSGMKNHRGEMQWLFDTFPDIVIEEHPIKFGSGDWTAGMSVTKGTFSAPMKLPNGDSIPPTGKTFKVHIVTLVKWKDGQIEEEYLFWDNADWNKQIGL